MLKKAFFTLLSLGIVAAIALWFLSAPQFVPAERLAAMDNGDVARGEIMFWTAGCASCHAEENAKGDEKLVLAGGMAFKTPFGTFYAPNISTHAGEGIGGWSAADFANAMLKGTTPDGSHYFPAFPYTSYSRMSDRDVADLWAYMKTLPASDHKVAEHDVPFPFNVRRAVGLWKLLFFHPGPVIALDNPSDKLARGQYLVEGPAHCGECHTPRNPVGGMNMGSWLGGGPSPDGPGMIPNITPHATGIGDWSEKDIAYSLESGFTPSFDSFGSSMVSVQQNMAKIPAADREAIAAYLKAVPAVASSK